MTKKYEIYSVKNYAEANKEWIKNNCKKLKKEELIIELKNNDKYYHFRIHPKNQYIFFGDLDNYNKDIINFFNILSNFLAKYYDIIISDNDIYYTQNNKKVNSYHYSIPKYNASTEKLKEIHENLIKIHKEEFIFKGDKKIEKIVDTTIYSEHWFRCPNQSKGSGNKNCHVIKKGEICNFIIDYIPENSSNINDKIFKSNMSIVKIPKKNELIEKESDNNLILSSTLYRTNIYKKMFDECYSQERFEIYDYWLSVGMALKNIFSNDEEAFELFNYYSSKGRNYEGLEKTKNKYLTLVKKNADQGYTVATIYYYAIADNKPKFIEIMSKNKMELEQTDVCKYLKIIAGNNFIYQKEPESDKYKLYCFNGKYWENDGIIFRQYVSEDLYNFLKSILVSVYWETKEFNHLKSKLNQLKQIKYKKDLLETYKEYGINNDVKFDDKSDLFAFNNIIYDLKNDCFINHQYENYISTTCGYDWIEPSPDEINELNNLIDSIMPIPEEKKLFLQILSTTLNGKNIENFIIFNGGGGNGKGVIDDLLLEALGNYGMIGNNAILFEKSSTGSNPEKANMHKKRLVVFREPSEKNKFENSVIKELTGGGTFSGRGHHESNTKKELNLTMIVECNKRPLLAEEPTDADFRRIIDLLFRSSFTMDKELIDNKKNIFEANQYYKTKEFQKKYKFALLKILFEAYKEYRENNYSFTIPKTIKDRTKNYLELSCNILDWFKEIYEKSDKSDDYLQIKNIYAEFINSAYYSNLSRNERKKYNKSYFQNYFNTNLFFRNNYAERFKNVRNVIKGWKIKIEEDE